MRAIERLLVAVAVLLFGFGLATLVVPEVAATVSVGTTALVVIGAGLLLAGLYALQSRYNADPQRSDLPEPELHGELPAPGDDVDTQLTGASARSPSRRRSDHRRTLRQRLARAAVDAQITIENRTESEATERLQSGEWTDDPHAAAFFIGQFPSWASRRVRLRALLTAREPFGRRASHAIDEIAAIVEGSDGQD